MSTTKSNLWSALSAARDEIAPFAKTADNPFFHSKYVPLDEILTQLVPIARKHGLYIFGRIEGDGAGGALQPTTDKNNNPTVTEFARGVFVTAVVHMETGETVEDRRPFVGIETAQNMGAFSSYSLRYGLSALFALILEDDDGNSASSGKGQGMAGKASHSPAKPVPARGVPSDQQGPPIVSSGRSGPAPHGAEFNRKGSDCPKCGAVGSVTVTKGGKTPGVWMCKPWEEKGWPGCFAKFTSDPATHKKSGNPFQDALNERPTGPGYGEPAPWTNEPVPAGGPAGPEPPSLADDGSELPF